MSAVELFKTNRLAISLASVYNTTVNACTGNTGFDSVSVLQVTCTFLGE